MAGLEDVLKAILEKENGGGNTKERADEILGIYLPDGEAQRMHEDAIRWTMHEVMLYGLNLISTREENAEAAKDWAKLMRACADHLVKHKYIKQPNRIPALDWWHTVESAKEAT